MREVRKMREILRRRGFENEREYARRVEWLIRNRLKIEIMIVAEPVLRAYGLPHQQ